MWTERYIKLTFFIPFLLGGALYSYFALRYLYSLPSNLHQPLDVVYAVYVSYLDMGVTFGISAVMALSIFVKLRSFFHRVKALPDGR